MSKRQLKPSASSNRAATVTFGSGFGLSSSSTFGTHASQLSHIAEPPDLSKISDPHVVVYFRNLSKRDSTTKAKALEELQTYISSLKTPVEDGVLEAWINLYPRTSIDNSKAVRQNAHALHGAIVASAGKRIAQHMPKCVGAWLCGLYDTDRSVAEATQNSLRVVFKSPEKIQNIRPLYQQRILEYCAGAIQNETPQTLSDERTVSPDDAASKYSRLISTCTAVVASLLDKLKEEEIGKYQEDYDSLLGDKKLWELSLHKDVSIRRSIHRLLQRCLEKQPDIIGRNLKVISKTYLANGLNSDQTGSSYDYIQALLLLTKAYPTVWTENYSSKTSVHRRLRQFLEKGSQLGPPDFWKHLVDLIKAIPTDLKLRPGEADAAQLLKALHGGVSRKEEPRPNLRAACEAYLEIAEELCQPYGPYQAQKLQKELVLPIVAIYLRPLPESSEWSVPSGSVELVAKALMIPGMQSVAGESWPQYSQNLVDAIRKSAPEQAQNYKQSQELLVTQASIVASLQHCVLESPGLEGLQAACSQLCENVITTSLSVLKNRNGKPYGAAGVIKEFVEKNWSLVSSNEGLKQQLSSFLQENLPELILSPSGPQLIEVLSAMSNDGGLDLAWKSALGAILSAEDSSQKGAVLDTVLTSHNFPPSVAHAHPELQDYIKSVAKAALQGSSDWGSFSKILLSKSDAIRSTTSEQVLSLMVDSLSISEEASAALEGFQDILKEDPETLRKFISSSGGTRLLQSLLLASQSPDDDIAAKATEVNASIQALDSSSSGSNQAIFTVIQENLGHSEPESLSVDTLFDLAKKLVGSMGLAKNATIDFKQVGGLFPRIQDWDQHLVPYLDIRPTPSHSYATALGGAAALVQSSPLAQESSDWAKEARATDEDGYSSLYRIAQYIVRLFDKDEGLFEVDALPVSEQRHYFRNLALTCRFARWNFSLPANYSLWKPWSPEWEQQSSRTLQSAEEMLSRVIKPSKGENSPLERWAWGVLSNAEAGLDSKSYHIADTATSLLTLSAPTSDIAELQSQLKSLRQSNSLYSLLGFLHVNAGALETSRTCERMCNELVADITGLRADSSPEEVLPKLLVLNAILCRQPGTVESVAKQRVIFFVRRVRPWLQDATAAPLPVRSEVCQSLTVLLPLMSDIYGEHWGDILSALTSSWQKTSELTDRDNAIPYVTASLRLYALLRNMTESEDPNDDIVDAWKERQKDLSTGLITLLKHVQDILPEYPVPLEYHISFQQFTRLLAGQIATVPLAQVGPTEELYPLLYVESPRVQQTAFNLLHRQIPVAQEQISIDAILEKKAARMPLELLSMVLDAPADLDLTNPSMVLSLRGYLFSWLLVFDHFQNASFKVKTDYVDQLKEGNYLSGLLDFTFTFLGHSRGKPIKFPASEDVTQWEAHADDDRRMTQRLLANLYSLSLQHLPSLTKSWFIDCKSRPIAVSLESWTETYISPRVIQAALKSVDEWAASQADEEIDSPFSVKVNPRAREIWAYYTFDEQTMSMRITLPPAYPLASAAIEGISRFVVSEQKWQSWLHASRGAITIFNGTLVDALTTFRRNVDGAIKGHTECAICYSIVGPDKKVPDKRCATCKNLFHGGCLFKWFKTSSSSTCPLCRTQINYA